MPALPWFEIFVGSYAAWVVLACASLLMSRRSPQATLAWMFAFIALPVVSGFYYLLFGPRRLQRRQRRYGVARAQAGRVSQHLRATACEKRPELSIDAAGLAAVGRRLGQGMPTFADEATFMDTNESTYERLAADIEAARHHVHLEYYIWEPDAVGTRFRDLLVAARGRGVEVRLLVDAVGSAAAKPKFWKPLRDAGGEVLVFNPVEIRTGRLHFANFRTHRKIAIVDGRVGYLGGVNLHENAWRDEHARIVGEPVRKLQRLFLEQWTYSGGAFSLDAATVPHYFPAATGEGRGVPTQILASGPDEDTAPLHAFFLAAIATARKRIWIETPYLIPDESLEAALRVAVLRDVDVQVVVPKQGDSRLVTAASHTYCDSLGRAGIHIFEYGPPMLHAKTLLVDDTMGIVGTANMDNRSFRLNFEIAAAFYDPGVIAHLARRFADDRAFSKPFPHKHRGPRLTQMLESVARLTSPVL